MEKYTMLLVDDEPNILRSLVRLFRNGRATVLTAPGGSEALEIIRREKIQLLITDNKMPGMTGIELIKHVRDISPETIRIILSGESDMVAVLKAVNEGEAYRFILKPWNDNELMITVTVALAHYKMAEDNQRLLAELKRKEHILNDLKARYPEICISDDHDGTDELPVSDDRDSHIMTRQ